MLNPWHRIKRINKNVTSAIHIKCFSSQCNSVREIFTEYFGMPPLDAKVLINENKITHADPINMMKTLKLLEEFKFDKNNLLHYPRLIGTHPVTVDQHYQVLSEAGFVTITPNILRKFRMLIGQKIGALKDASLLPKTADVASNFIRFLDPCPESFSVHTKGDDDTIANINMKVFSAYMKWRLGWTDAHVEEMYRVHFPIKHKCYKYLCQNIKRAEELKFTPIFMLKFGYILHAYPKYTETTLTKYGNLAGCNMKLAMRKYPKLVTTSPDNILKIYNILKENNIPDVCMRNNPNIFHMSPETVKLRLEQIRHDEDIAVLMHDERILRLIIHHNRTKSRLNFMKKLQLRCAAVEVLGRKDQDFDIHISEGQDVNYYIDVDALLKDLFKQNYTECIEMLKKHPHYLCIPIPSIQQTYKYLLQEKISVSAITQVIHIILYHESKVREAFEKIKSYETENGLVLEDIRRLNLALYFMEKDYYFNGDGVLARSEVQNME